MINDTWVNIEDRIILYKPSTAVLAYVEFDHNTFVQNMNAGGMWQLAGVGSKVKLTNNLLVNAFTMGRDTSQNDDARNSEFRSNGVTNEYESNGLPKECLLTAINIDSTQFVIRNNYYCYDQDELNFWKLFNLLEPYTMLDSIAKKVADTTKAFIKESGIIMGNIPDVAKDLMNWFYTPTDQGGAGMQSIANPGLDYDRKSLSYIENDLDCKYNTSSLAYTGADNGLPAGDLNWWSIPTGIKNDTRTGIPGEFSLSQNYPNPFNPTTNIKFSLPKASKVTLIVYNILGQRVAQLINEDLNAGNYNYKFDATNLSSGIYLYRIQTDNYMQTKKMILLK